MKDLTNYEEPVSSSKRTMGDHHGKTKPKPKVQIIHVFAPRIIRTDVKNFRQLVQRLTGKPNDIKGGSKRPVKNTGHPTGMGKKGLGNQVSNAQGRMNGMNTPKEELGGGSANTFFDLEGLIHGYGDGFSPIFPVRSSQMDGYHHHHHLE